MAHKRPLPWQRGVLLLRAQVEQARALSRRNFERLPTPAISGDDDPGNAHRPRCADASGGRFPASHTALAMVRNLHRVNSRVPIGAFVLLLHPCVTSPQLLHSLHLFAREVRPRITGAADATLRAANRARAERAELVASQQASIERAAGAYQDGLAVSSMRYPRPR